MGLAASRSPDGHKSRKSAENDWITKKFLSHSSFGLANIGGDFFILDKKKFMEDWLYIIIVGGLAGWIGSLLFKGSGSGLIINIILGILGAIVGGWIFDKLNIVTSGFLGSIITAAVGAFVVLWIYNLILGRRR